MIVVCTYNVCTPSMTTPSNRNPVIVPEKKRVRRCCPKCFSGNFVGRNIQGLVKFTCQACGHKWYGGIGQEPQDPTAPLPPVNPSDRPAVEVVAVRDKRGEIVGSEEIRNRKVDLVQEFRKGAPIPEDEEY